MSVGRSLRGGVQPPTHKAISTRHPIRTPALAPLLALPLGGARPVVEDGMPVDKGQLLAIGSERRIHASSSGRVLGIEEHAVGPGRHGLCVLLETDGEDRWHPDLRAPDLESLDRTGLLAAVAAAGIAGLGGGGFPTARKIAAGTGLHTLVINGMECEPYVTADDLLMREHATAIVAGAKLAARLLDGPEQILVGIEDDKPEATAAMRRAAEGTDIRVVSLATRYPSGGERQLIALLTGTQVPDDRLPQDLGILCLNVGTLYALQRGLGHGEPLVSRIVTLSGGACHNPGNYRVPFGTPIAHLLAAADCQSRDCAGLVLGGAMMGEPLEDLQVPVTPTAHCVLALTAAELPPPQSRPCIRCGLCATACPVALLPQQLHRYALVGNHRELERHHLSACIECGACNYVCPSGIPLARQFRTAKAELEARRTARRQADRDRQRFAAHQERRTAEARARDSRHAALANPESPPENRALDLARLAMARAASPRENHHQALQRAAMAAADRVRRLEIQFDQLPPDTGSQQRKALLARVEQAHIDHREAQRRLAESGAPARKPGPNGDSG